jgi:hypothetical protein
VCAKIAQNVAEAILRKNKYTTLKNVGQKCGLLSKFSNAQSKEAPNGRKFAQSGHPGLQTKF